MMLKDMLKEEWRMHSRLFKGRSFAMFPVLVFALSLGFTWIVSTFSTISLASYANIFPVIGLFLGLGVGSTGFSNRDALKNVLGPVNFLVYSSRTLPISETRTLATFLLKDFLYYNILFLLPIGLGALIPLGFAAGFKIALMFAAFIAGVVFSLILARITLHIPGADILNYPVRRMPPLASKSIIDLSRSSGGFLKVVFSLGILTAFYWFIVLYFPFAQTFLKNPLLSFSVLLGTFSLTIYNWLNRFDQLEDYLYLPVGKKTLLEAKQEAFVAVSTSLILLLLVISYLLYPSYLVLSVITALSVMIYTLGAASLVTGLQPNSKIYDTTVFLKYMILSFLAVLPLLVLSIVYARDLLWVFLGLVILVDLGGVGLIKLSRGNR